LVIEPWCRLCPLECSLGTRPREGHERARRAEAPKVAGLGEQRHGSERVDAAEGAQARHGTRQRLGERQLGDLLVDRAKLRVAHEVGAQQVLEGGLRGGL